jgi:cytochrome d ubiquinol oxidase subunit II
LAIFFGAALGNVVRGVPLNASGEFFLPLWTDFTPGPNAGVLDWYTILTGVFAFLTLTAHGALWINLKTEAEVQARARRIARVAWICVAVLTVAVTAISFDIQPHLSESFAAMPAGYVFPLLALAGLAGMYVFLRKGDDLMAFLSSCTFIVGMLTSVVFGVFPYVLPANTNPQFGLTIHNASAPQYGLWVGVLWFVPGILLAAGYSIYTHRRFGGKVRPDESGYGH